MKSLNPEHVIPGHGPPTTTKLFDDGEKYYALLAERVAARVKEGKSLDDITKEVKNARVLELGQPGPHADQHRRAAHRMVAPPK